MRRSSIIFAVFAALMFVVALPLGLAAQVADSLPGPIPASGPLNFAAALLIGIGASVGTKAVSGIATAADNAIGTVDGAIRNAVGPLLPAVTVGLSILLPVLGNKIGVADLPPADVVANAPLAAIIGVSLREAARKWVLPLVGRL